MNYIPFVSCWLRRSSELCQFHIFWQFPVTSAYILVSFSFHCAKPSHVGLLVHTSWNEMHLLERIALRSLAFSVYLNCKVLPSAFTYCLSSSKWLSSSPSDNFHMKIFAWFLLINVFATTIIHCALYLSLSSFVLQVKVCWAN